MYGKLNTQIIHLKLYSKNTFMKKNIFIIILLLSSINIYALSHYSNDFRDINNSINITYTLDGRSTTLAFDTFENEDASNPKYENQNYAFAEHYYDLYYNFSTFKVGVFKEELGEISINSGLMETVLNVQKDFFKLLRAKTINNDLEKSIISGDANYYNTEGFFLQKIFSYNQTHFLSVKLKIHYADELQNIQINGETNSEHFRGSFDYYYANENYITNGETQSNPTKGRGYGIDLEYIYQKDNIYLYLGAFNVGSYIYWDNVTYMHYDLDSQTIYKGADGYNHARPFGIGKYEYNISFKQKLPEFYKSSIDYTVGNNISVGYNLNIYNNISTNEPTVSYSSKYLEYKLGYIYENNELIFGAYTKYMKLEISNSFGAANNIVRANIKLSY